MTPYYEDGSVVIYHADSSEVFAGLAFDAIVTDPPYGINATTMNASRGRGRGPADKNRPDSARRSNALAYSKDYAPIHGDDRPFDPAPFLAAAVPTVLFGGNHYAHRLPASPTWLVWDKLDGLTTDKRDVGFCDQADAELAWTNLGGPARVFRQRWMGAMKSGVDKMTPRRHPTEKPLELMRWVVGQVPGERIIDPFMGSGSTLRAAKDLNRHAIGIEIVEAYCEIAAKRCAQEVLAL